MNNLFNIKNVKDNIIYKILVLVLFIVIITIGTIYRFSIENLPVMNLDSQGYLNSTLNLIAKGEWGTSVRSFLYPFFLFVILKIFSDFSAINIIQHLLGVLSGILLFYCWNCLYTHFSKNSNKHLKFTYQLLGLFLLAAYIFHFERIIYEHTIAPESIFSFMFILLFTIILLLANKTKSDSNKKIFFFIALVALFINTAIFTLQPRWTLAFIMNNILYLILVYKMKEKLLRKILVYTIIPFLVCYLFLILPNNQFTKYSASYKTFPYKIAFYWHLNLINDVLKDDYRNPNFNKYDKGILRLIGYNFEEERIKGAINYYTLGYDPDKLIWGEIGSSLDNYFKINHTNIDTVMAGVENYNDFLFSYFYRGVKRNPNKYFSKLFNELSIIYRYGLVNERIYKNLRMYLYWYPWLASYQLIQNDPEKLGINYKPFNEYITRTFNYNRVPLPKNHLFIHNLDKVMHTYYSIIGRLYVPIWITFSIFFLTNIILRIIKKRMVLTQAGYWTFYLFLISFTINLNIALVQTLSVVRFTTDQFIILMFGMFFAIAYCLFSIKEYSELLLEKYTRKR